MKYLTTVQLASAMGVSPRQVQVWARKGRIKGAEKYLGRWRFAADYKFV